MRILRIAVWAATLVLMGGCASVQTPTVSEPVGPAPAGSTTVTSSGALQVYSATERHEIGQGTYYYPHTSYAVCDSAGHRVKSVPNHSGWTDQTPSVVPLPAGDYLVVAEAEGYGRVRIPVTVKPRQMTVLHLERGWKPPEEAKASDLVLLPDGQPIGWRADLGKARRAQ